MDSGSELLWCTATEVPSLEAPSLCYRADVLGESLASSRGMGLRALCVFCLVGVSVYVYSGQWRGYEWAGCGICCMLGLSHGLVSKILQYNVGSGELCASCMIIWSAGVWLGAAGSSVGRQQHQNKEGKWLYECQKVCVSRRERLPVSRDLSGLHLGVSLLGAAVGACIGVGMGGLVDVAQ
jgi:hypothetical protein